jgi:hypothetical protein
VLAEIGEIKANYRKLLPKLAKKYSEKGGTKSEKSLITSLENLNVGTDETNEASGTMLNSPGDELSSPNTPITPITPITPDTPTSLSQLKSRPSKKKKMGKFLKSMISPFNLFSETSTFNSRSAQSEMHMNSLQGSRIKSLSETNISDKKRQFSLYEILLEKDLFDEFIQFSFDTQTYENIFFFMSVYIFKDKCPKLNQEQMADEIQKIIELFILNGSSLELNIDATMKIETVSKPFPRDATMFDDLLIVVNDLMNETLSKIRI